MAKPIQRWLEVSITNDGRVRVEGRQYMSVRQQDGQECWLYITPSEVDWLIAELVAAKYKITGSKT